MVDIHNQKRAFAVGKTHESNRDFLRQSPNQIRAFTWLSRNQTTSYRRKSYSWDNTLLGNLKICTH